MMIAITPPRTEYEFPMPPTKLIMPVIRKIAPIKSKIPPNILKISSKSIISSISHYPIKSTPKMNLVVSRNEIKPRDGLKIYYVFKKLTWKLGSLSKCFFWVVPVQ